MDVRADLQAYVLNLRLQLKNRTYELAALRDERKKTATYCNKVQQSLLDMLRHFDNWPKQPDAADTETIRMIIQDAREIISP